MIRQDLSSFLIFFFAEKQFEIELLRFRNSLQPP